MPKEPIRLLHFADLHIGIENYGRLDPSTGVNSRVRDFLDRLDEVVAYALENEADLVVFAGDAYKTRDPNPTYQRAFARRVKQLVDAGVPVVLLVGNHDLPTMPQRASTVDIFQTLAVPNVYVGREEGVFRIQTRRGPVQVAVVPFPIRTRLLAHEEFRGLSLPDLDAALQKIVTDNIGALARQIDPEVPAVLTAHLSVSGATYGSERGVMIGRDTVILLSALTDPVWDYVALGHIHKHQSLHNGHPPVVYAGSLERIDFGEEREPKGFCWVQLRRGETTWRFVEVKARPFVTIEADLREAGDPLAMLREAVARYDFRNAVVRVILRLRPEQEKQVREADVRRLLEGAAFVAGIRSEVERKARLRLGTMRPEELTPIQLLERYLEVKAVPQDRRQELIEAAREIFSGGE
ncbi:MAG: exonuclease SbcCD subunit D [Anaerolineae bacterium]|nr:exonuclease SbcCD subunit D [Anaerolineae bacterium]MCX8066702.1 exonuclease SbcCD subunit D [Anaerolineae bacterium]MDW7993000.1 exonuclease SbcCD subunit D [Anaerolineae bacterium]